jgi:thiamine-monophosphate kinase
MREVENLPQSLRERSHREDCAITVAEVGEFGLIERIRRTAPQVRGVNAGIGDDAAWLDCPGRNLLVTTDLLIDAALPPDWSTATDVGRKAAAQNLADVAAMGAAADRPAARASRCRRTCRCAWLEELADGMRAECEPRRQVLGGDGSARTLVLAVTAFGDPQGRAPVTGPARSGRSSRTPAGWAGPRPGWPCSGAGSARRWAWSRRTAAPKPPYAQGPRAAELGATAMVDVSDGLVATCGTSRWPARSASSWTRRLELSAKLQRRRRPRSGWSRCDRAGRRRRPRAGRHVPGDAPRRRRGQ